MKASTDRDPLRFEMSSGSQGSAWGSSQCWLIASNIGCRERCGSDPDSGQRTLFVYETWGETDGTTGTTLFATTTLFDRAGGN